MSPRERAHRRGIDFPTLGTDHRWPPASAPAAKTFTEVLDGLTRLTQHPVHPIDGYER
jgi:hypothetical protein